MKVLKISKQAIKEAVVVIKNGGVIAFPSDTVYGLLSDATNKQAIAKIFEIKERLKTKPLGIFISSIKMAKTFAKIDERIEKLLSYFWPGPLTVILKTKTNLPGVTLNRTIGLRMPDSSLMFEIFKKIDIPLAQTSANISGQPAAIKIAEVLEYFKDRKIKPDLILDGGDLKKAVPSTVIDLKDDKLKIIRRGRIKKKDVLEKLKN